MWGVCSIGGASLQQKKLPRERRRKTNSFGREEPILGIPLVPRVEAVQVHIPAVGVPVRVHREDGSIVRETVRTTADFRFRRISAVSYSEFATPEFHALTVCFLTIGFSNRSPPPQAVTSDASVFGQKNTPCSETEQGVKSSRGQELKLRERRTETRHSTRSSRRSGASTQTSRRSPGTRTP